VINNRFVHDWEYRPDEHRTLAANQRPAYADKVANGDPDDVGVWVGEATGLINDVPSAATIIERTIAEAEQIIERLTTLRRD
jgi:nitronate monooxygenase